MSSKLDQSLDEIAGSRRANARRQRPAKARVSTGGVNKNTVQKAAKPAKAAPAPARAPPASGEGKILVSNLPSDVNEVQIKDYFSSQVGPVKKVLLNYNKTGRSVGVATIIFHKNASAAEAVKLYDGVQVDGRPMKVEVILGAQFAPTPAAPKTLGERIAQPKKENAKAKAKATPKSAAAAPKAASAAKDGASARGNGRGKRGGRAAGRPKAKTVEELDAEMSEYFVPNAGGAEAAGSAPAAPAATDGGDAAMVDEVL